MTKDNSQWFASWFNTPYYYMLYKDRDYKEAEVFMHNLTNYLNLPEKASILDLACGKGRHATYLNTLGYNVTGVDLSENSINHAKQFENETLTFNVHDMSKPYGKTFDAVFNLFTSFGYFENEVDNLKTIASIKSNLNASGFGVIDFMNVEHVINNLVAEDSKTVNNITFTQKRSVQNNYIVKDIYFNTENKDYHFQERVRAFSLNDFEHLLEQANCHLLEVFGDYKLGPFHPKNSKRLILLFK